MLPKVKEAFDLVRIFLLRLLKLCNTLIFNKLKNVSAEAAVPSHTGGLSHVCHPQIYSS